MPDVDREDAPAPPASPAPAPVVLEYASNITPRRRRRQEWRLRNLPPTAAWVFVAFAALSVVLPYLLGRAGVANAGTVGVVYGASLYACMRLSDERLGAAAKTLILLSAGLWAAGLAVAVGQSEGNLDYWLVYNQTYRGNYDRSIPWLQTAGIGVLWCAAVELAAWRGRRRTPPPCPARRAGLSR